MRAQCRISVQVDKLALEVLVARWSMSNNPELNRYSKDIKATERCIEDGIGKCNCEIVRKASPPQCNRHNRLPGIGRIQLGVRWTGGRKPAPQRINDNRGERVHDWQNTRACDTRPFTEEVASRLENYLPSCAVDKIVRIREYLIGICVESDLKEMVVGDKFGIHHLHVQRSSARA